MVRGCRTALKGMVCFLGLFHVVGPGEAVAVDAVLSIVTTKPALPDAFVFSTVLKMKSIFFLPVINAFAFIMQGAYKCPSRRFGGDGKY